MEQFRLFLKRKNILISAKRYGIDALGAMAQGLFASLLMGTILATAGEQLGIPVLEAAGGYAKAATGAAMAVSIGYALQCPQLVLFSLAAVGIAANEQGGAGGPLAVLLVSIAAAEFGKAVSKETKVDILVTPFVTIMTGILLSLWLAPAIGAAASAVGAAIMWATELQPFFYGNYGFCAGRNCTYTANQQCSNMCSAWINRACRRCGTCRVLCTDGWFCSVKLPGK